MIYQIIINSAFIHFIIVVELEFILRSLEIIIILRGLRVLKLFNEVQQWKVIMRTIGALLKPFSSLLLVSYILFLVFSIIGERAFGGLANMSAEGIFRDTSIPDSYVQMNFNDIANSFVTLFALLVVNNWFVIVSVFETLTGTIYTRLFFIIFYFLGVIVVLNIVVAFAIDMYSSVDTINSQKTEKENLRSKSLVSETDTQRKGSISYNHQDRENEIFEQKLTRFNTQNVIGTNELLNHSEEGKGKIRGIRF